MANRNVEKIESLLASQENIIESLKNEITTLDNESILHENEQLKEELAVVKTDNESLKQKNKELENSLTSVKSALFSRMANEKLALFNKTQKEIDKVYYRENKSLDSRLAAYKKRCLKNINQIIARINSLGSENYADILSSLTDLEHEVNSRYKELEEQKISAQKELSDKAAADYNQLKNEPLTQEEKNQAFKQKSIESFIGLNILSKAGILLFIVGIIALGRFAYTYLPDVFKSLMIYALGAGLIGGGEFFNKKEKTVFSTALISGGVAVLYAATATSYFALNLISVQLTFVLCIAVTVLAIVLSLQTKNQVVCAFGAVGGYLPLVATYMIGFGSGSAAADKSFLLVSAVYFCLLSAVVFIMTYNKKWYAAQYIGYAFQVAAVVGISRCAYVLKDVAGFDFALPLAVAFAVISFVIYMLMPVSRLVGGKKITVSDSVLLGLNTLSGAVSVSVAVQMLYGDKKAVGFVLLAFALVYSAILLLSNRSKETSGSFHAAKYILIVGVFAFSLLVVPFVFGIQYAAIAWAVEGAVVALYAMKRRLTALEISGVVCMCLSPVVMLILSMFDEWYTYLCLASATVFVLCFWCYIAKAFAAGKKAGYVEPIYIVMQLLLTTVTIGYGCYAAYFVKALPFVKYYSDFTQLAVILLFVLGLTVLARIRMFKTTASEIYSLAVRFGVLLAAVVGINVLFDYDRITLFFGGDSKQKALVIVNAVLLFVINIFSGLLFSFSVQRIISKFALKPWIYTLAISASALALITSLLMGQFDVKFSNVIISAVYITAACVMLFIGFKKRYTIVRSGGLALILIALAKLFFVDTHALDTAWKIASYFAFGAILILISYFYQRFSKKLENEITNTMIEQ